MRTQFSEEGARSSCWMECRVLLEKEMAGAKTRDVSTDLLTKRIECFPKGSRLIRKMREGRRPLEMVPKQWSDTHGFSFREFTQVGVQKQKWLGAGFQCPFSHCECFRFYSEMKILSRGRHQLFVFKGEFCLLVESKLCKEVRTTKQGPKAPLGHRGVSGLNNCNGGGVVRRVCFIGYI